MTDLNTIIYSLRKNITDSSDMISQLKRDLVNYKKNEIELLMQLSQAQEKLKNLTKPYDIIYHVNSYQNCSAKYNLNKDRCSELIFSYPEFESNNEQFKNKTEQLNVITEKLLFPQTTLDDEVTRFSTEAQEYWSESGISVFIKYLSNRFYSAILEEYLWSEGTDCIFIGDGRTVIYDITEKQELNFEDIFSDHTENEIKLLLFKNLDDNKKGGFPESGKIEDFLVDFDRFFISNEGYRKGFCFYCGPIYDCLDQTIVTIPFDKCQHLL